MNEIGKMPYDEVRKELDGVWEKARPLVGPSCKACRECTGKNCRRPFAIPAEIRYTAYGS